MHTILEELFCVGIVEIFDSPLLNAVFVISVNRIVIVFSINVNGLGMHRTCTLQGSVQKCHLLMNFKFIILDQTSTQPRSIKLAKIVISWDSCLNSSNIYRLGEVVRRHGLLSVQNKCM